MDISLIMPLRLRGGYATECHAFSYYTSSSALIFSPPCGSCSVFEVAHTVYKNALNECSFIRLRAKHAKHQADNLAKLWQDFLSLLELIAKIFCAVVIAKTSEVGGNRHCVFVSI